MPHNLIGRRITGTIVSQYGIGRFLIEAEEMSESQFVLPPQLMWKLRNLLKNVSQKSPSPLQQDTATEILEALDENVLSGAKGSNRG